MFGTMIMHGMHDSALNGVDLNLLLVLRTLLAEGHVTRAAARLGLSQSATSHALTRLRALYGDPLLVRSGKRLALTPRATELLPELERGLAALQSTLSGVPSFDPSAARRRFSLAMADYSQALLLGPLLARLQEQAPGVDLNVLAAPNIAELIAAGQVDLGVVVPRPASGSLRTRRISRDRFVCIVRKGHPGVRKALDLERYLQLRHVLVAPNGAPGSVVDAELARRKLERRVALQVSSFLVAPVVVSESDFVNTGPERLARRWAQLYPIDVHPPPFRLPPFEVYLLWHPRFERDAAHAWLRDLVATVSADDL